MREGESSIRFLHAEERLRFAAEMPRRQGSGEMFTSRILRILFVNQPGRREDFIGARTVREFWNFSLGKINFSLPSRLNAESFIFLDDANVGVYQVLFFKIYAAHQNYALTRIIIASFEFCPSLRIIVF